MLRSLFTSATGLAAQQLNLDVVANNLANVSTNGFKKSRVDFQDIVYQTLREPGGQTGPNSTLPTGAQVGLGVSAGSISPIHTQGTLLATGSQYDVAIRGSGYLRVQLPDGSIGYTRSGSFNIDGTGRLVTSEGYLLQPEVIIPPNTESVNVSPDGTVLVKRAGETNTQQVGQIQMSNFLNPAGLRAMGSNLFAPTPASGQPVDGAPGSQGLGTLLNRYVEASNVDVVEEMVKMIILQRAYDTNSKVIQAADEMLSTTNTIKR